MSYELLALLPNLLKELYIFSNFKSEFYSEL
jgi:hypothetical protein